MLFKKCEDKIATKDKNIKFYIRNRIVLMCIFICNTFIINLLKLFIFYY